MHRRARARPRLATRRRRRLHVQVPCALALTQKAARAGARARTFTEHSLSLGRGGVVGSKRGKPEDEDTESDTYLATVQKGPSALCICVGLPNLPYAHCTYMQPYCIILHTLHICAYICILFLSYIYCPVAGAREIGRALGSSRAFWHCSRAFRCGTRFG